MTFMFSITALVFTNETIWGAAGIVTYPENLFVVVFASLVTFEKFYQIVHFIVCVYDLNYEILIIYCKKSKT